MSAETVESTAVVRIDGRLPAAPNQFAKYLQARKGAIQSVAAGTLTSERLTKIVLRCVSMTPGLQRCTMESVFRATLMAAELGLEPGSALGEAYLVPYGQVCQMIPGYRGLVTLARRSGQVQDVYARAVFEGDEFTVTLGTDESIVHVPKFGSRKADKLTYVYAVAKLVGGGVHTDIMTRAEVDEIRSRSASSGKGPWVTDYVEMAKKTVTKRMTKMLPLSIELVKAVSLDNALDSGDFSNVDFDCLTADDVAPLQNVPRDPDPQEQQPARGTEALKDKLKGNGGQGAPDEPTVNDLALAEQARRDEAKPPLTGAQKKLAADAAEEPNLELAPTTNTVPGAFN